MKLTTTLQDGTKSLLFAENNNLLDDNCNIELQLVPNGTEVIYEGKNYIKLGTLSTRNNIIDFKVKKSYINTTSNPLGNFIWDYERKQYRTHISLSDSFISLVKSLEKEAGLLEKNPYGEELPDTNDAYYITSWHKFNSDKYEKDLKQWQQAEQLLIPAKWLVLIESK